MPGIPPPLQSALLKVLIPLAAIAVVLRVTRRRSADWRRVLALEPPPAREAALWIAVYMVWMLGSDALFHWRGPWDFDPWVRQGVLVSVLRVLAVGFLGPVMEELVVRGVAFDRLLPRIGPAATVGVTAVAWAALHVQYAPWIIALLAVDGVLLGVARLRSGSVYVPIAMHVLWNLYAVW